LPDEPPEEPEVPLLPLVPELPGVPPAVPLDEGAGALGVIAVPPLELELLLELELEELVLEDALIAEPHCLKP
jgi:hypothetical protein